MERKKINWEKFKALFSREELELTGFYYFKVKGKKIKLHKGVAKKAYLRSGIILRIGKNLFNGKAEFSSKMKPTSGFIQVYKGKVIPASKINGKLTKNIKATIYGLVSDKKVKKQEELV